MPIDSTHPQYGAMLSAWEQLSDCYAGEDTVKSKGTTYLPATSGMRADGMDSTTAPGYLAYQAYKTRAVFPDLINEAVEAMVGILNRKPPTIELPKKLEPLRDKATLHGESLETLLRKINEAQFIHGRFGLLAEVPNDMPVNEALPYIVPYTAISIRNWDDGSFKANKRKLELVVLDESGYDRNTDLEWELKYRYRVLITSTALATLGANEQGDVALGTYMAGSLEKGDSITPDKFIAPSIGGKTMDEIPFTFINTNDLVASPDKPPLLGLSNLSLTIYRGEADYRQTLFMQGQETLVIIGASPEEGEESGRRVGAGAFLDLPAGGDAKYVGVSSAGLAEQRQALENDKKEAMEKGARLLDFSDASQQSGDALRIRVASKTATLTSIAQTAAEGLQDILRKIAVWVGADPMEVKVTPNMSFTDEEMTGQEAVQWMQAKALGAPISKKSIHEMFQARKATSKTFEEEIDEIDEEGPLLEGTGMPGDPSLPNDQNNQNQNQNEGE